MIAGIAFTAIYILMFQFNLKPSNWLLALLSSWEPGSPKPPHSLLGISPAGIGAVGMCINFAVSFIVSMLTAKPPDEVQDLVEQIRIPSGAGEAHEMQVPPA